ncbi:hypothetical protein RI103_13990 [Paraburkholderia sp. FT54]|uniref:hypothetical protein n=1 Tax=Paraburkholderia sp. FT54 TaxID=3074437 RepID=UPI0028776ECF|nr:hypothetical protein [Paraburkholderia sp. FT54]WNC88811.1 hypothetical protein RI103_13990 [Paraburkholderia sp. FT54]
MSDENRNLIVQKAKALLHPIANEAEYDGAVSVLNALLDLPESSEGGPLAGLLVALGEFIGDYEDARRADEVRDES